VLDRFRKAKLTLKLKKCNFMCNEITFLGHKISERGIELNPARIDAIKKYPKPTDTDEVRAMLGFFSYFRTFIPRFAIIVDPINQLLKKNTPFVWKDEHEKAFNEIKKILMSPPVLQFPRFNKPFYIATDASGHGIGSVLSQEVNGILLPISYASRSLNKNERNYSTTKKEMLGIVYALKQYKYLIFGYEVKVLTDHRPCTYLLRKEIPDGILGRWILSFQEFEVQLLYYPGKLNILADTMSRLKDINQSSTPLTLQEKDHENIVSTLSCNVKKTNNHNPNNEENWSVEELIIAQYHDPEIRNIKDKLNEKDKETEKLYFTENDILFRKEVIRRCDSELKYDLLVLPTSLLLTAIQSAHCPIDQAHFNNDRTFIKLRVKYYHPDLRRMTNKFCNECEICIKYKGKRKQPVPVGNIPLPSTPWEKVSFDILGPMTETLTGNKYILVFTDYLTRYSIIIPIKDKRTETIAEKMRQHVIYVHSCPKILISDNAKEFTSEVIRKLCEFCGIRKIEVTPYRPQANGLVERTNSKILNVLRIYVNEHFDNWDIMLPEVAASINSAYNVSINENPHFALYGYDKRSPYQWIEYDTKVAPIYNYSDYSTVIQNRATKTFKFLKERLQKSTDDYIKTQHKHAKQREMFVNQRCFVKYIPTINENKKLAKKWDGPYIIAKKLSKHVYEVKNHINDKIVRVHIDNMLPYNKLTDKSITYQDVPVDTDVIPKTSQNKNKQVERNLNDEWTIEDRVYFPQNGLHDVLTKRNQTKKNSIVNRQEQRHKETETNDDDWTIEKTVYFPQEGLHKLLAERKEKLERRQKEHEELQTKLLQDRITRQEEEILPNVDEDENVEYFTIQQKPHEEVITKNKIPTIRKTLGQNSANKILSPIRNAVRRVTRSTAKEPLKALPMFQNGKYVTKFP
jgi:hypothetical protein